MRPAESLETARRPVFPRGQFPAARDWQAGFAESEGSRPKTLDHGWTPINTAQRRKLAIRAKEHFSVAADVIRH